MDSYVTHPSGFDCPNPGFTVFHLVLVPLTLLGLVVNGSALVWTFVKNLAKKCSIFYYYSGVTACNIIAVVAYSAELVALQRRLATDSEGGCLAYSFFVPLLSGLHLTLTCVFAAFWCIRVRNIRHLLPTVPQAAAVLAVVIFHNIVQAAFATGGKKLGLARGNFDGVPCAYSACLPLTALGQPLNSSDRSSLFSLFYYTALLPFVASIILIVIGLMMDRAAKETKILIDTEGVGDKKVSAEDCELTRYLVMQICIPLLFGFLFWLAAVVRYVIQRSLNQVGDPEETIHYIFMATKFLELLCYSLSCLTFTRSQTFLKPDNGSSSSSGSSGVQKRAGQMNQWNAGPQMNQ